MATLPFAVEAGSAAAGYTGGLLNPADLKRIAHDLSAMPRKRIEGPDVPQARAVLVPLCHDSRTKVPHALFAVKPDDFGAPHAGFPGGPRHNDDSDDIGAVREAIRELGLGDGASLRILGVASDAVDVAQAVRGDPRGGRYLGELDVEEMTSMSALEKSERTLMAVRLDDLLGKEAWTSRWCRESARCRCSMRAPGRKKATGGGAGSRSGVCPRRSCTRS